MAGETEKLSWIFELVDKYTAQSERMEKSTARFEATLMQTSRALTDLEKHGRKAGEALSGIGRAMSVAGEIGAGLRTAALLAAGLGAGIGYAAYEAAKFSVETLAFKENTLVSFGLMLGDAEKAKQLYKDASNYARITPFETKDVVGGFQRLISAGFNIDQTKVLFQALGDVASSAGERGTESFNHLVMVLGHLRSMPKVTAMEMKELSYWSSTMGVGLEQILDSYARARGISKEAAQAEHASGGMQSDALIYAFTDAIRLKTGGRVGELQLRQAHTITGLLSTLRSAPFDFINTMDPDSSPGLKKFKGFLENLTTLLDTNTASGRRFAELFDRVFNDTFSGIFGDLSGPEGAHALEDFFKSAIGTAGKLYDTVKSFVGVMEKLAPTLKTVENILDRINRVMDEGFVAKGSYVDRYQKFNSGIVGGVSNYLTNPVFSGTVNAADPNALGLERSDIGQSVSAPGVDEAELQTKALGEMITAAGFSSIGESVKAPARAGVVVHLNLNLDARGASDPAAILQAIRDMLPAELENLFAKLALESGS